MSSSGSTAPGGLNGYLAEARKAVLANQGGDKRRLHLVMGGCATG